MGNKIFCSKCDFMKYMEKEYYCFAPDNMKQVDNWFERDMIPLNHPREINKNNDCKWFENKDE